MKKIDEVKFHINSIIEEIERAKLMTENVPDTVGDGYEAYYKLGVYEETVRYIEHVAKLIIEEGDAQ